MSRLEEVAGDIERADAEMATYLLLEAFLVMADRASLASTERTCAGIVRAFAHKVGIDLADLAEALGRELLDAV